jgi:hypothetical protein
MLFDKILLNEYKIHEVVKLAVAVSRINFDFVQHSGYCTDWDSFLNIIIMQLVMKFKETFKDIRKINLDSFIKAFLKDVVMREKKFMLKINTNVQKFLNDIIEHINPEQKELFLYALQNMFKGIEDFYYKFDPYEYFTLLEKYDVVQIYIDVILPVMKKKELLFEKDLSDIFTNLQKCISDPKYISYKYHGISSVSSSEKEGQENLTMPTEYIPEDKKPEGTLEEMTQPFKETTQPFEEVTQLY